MYFAGIDVGGSSVKLCIMSDAGSVVWEDVIPTITGDPDALARSIAAALKSTGFGCAAAGISCAGRVNKETNTIIASNLRWKNVPFADIFEKHMHCPVAIDNDVAGALYGEWSQGACQDESCVAYVALGTGVGGAFIIDGKPFRGYNNTGGEIGHMITHADGLPCACGGRGCFEQYASATALSRMADGLEPPEVFRRAEEGDPAMCEVLTAYAHELAIGLANVIGVFRPRLIALGGGLAGAGRALLDRVTEQLIHHCPSMPSQEIPAIRLATLGNRGGMIGGAMMARDLWLSRREQQSAVCAKNPEL